MTQQIVGYQLIETATQAVVQSWGGTWGQCPGVPNPLILPNGDHVCGVSAGDAVGSWTLQAWMMDEPVPTEADYGVAIQALVETTAKARGYNDSVTCASYTASTIARWKADATAFISWRDAVWQYAYAQLAAVQAGTRSQPTVDGMVAEITDPTKGPGPIAWPA